MFKLDAEDQAAILRMAAAMRPVRRWFGLACAILGSAIVLGLAFRLFELVAGV